MTDLSPALHATATRTSKSDSLRIAVFGDDPDVKNIQQGVDDAHQQEQADDDAGMLICLGALLAMVVMIGGIVVIYLHLALP